MKSRRSITPLIKFFGTVVFLAGFLLWAYCVFLVCRLLGARFHALAHHVAGPQLLGALDLVPATAATVRLRRNGSR